MGNCADGGCELGQGEVPPGRSGMLASTPSVNIGNYQIFSHYLNIFMTTSQLKMFKEGSWNATCKNLAKIKVYN